MGVIKMRLTIFYRLLFSMFSLSCQHPGVLFDQPMPVQASAKFSFPDALLGRWSAVLPDTAYNPGPPMRVVHSTTNLVISSKLMYTQAQTISEGPIIFLDTVDGGKYKNRKLLDEELKSIGGKMDFLQDRFRFFTELNDTLFVIDTINHLRKSDHYWVLNRRDAHHKAWILGWMYLRNDTLEFMYPTRADSLKITKHVNSNNVRIRNDGLIELHVSDSVFKQLLDLDWNNRRFYVRQ